MFFVCFSKLYLHSNHKVQQQATILAKMHPKSNKNRKWPSWQYKKCNLSKADIFIISAPLCESSRMIKLSAAKKFNANNSLIFISLEVWVIKFSKMAAGSDLFASLAVFQTALNVSCSLRHRAIFHDCAIYFFTFPKNKYISLSKRKTIAYYHKG